jgi:hypothetical protein
MMSVWASYLLFYFLSPIKYNRIFSGETIAFLASCLLFFVIGTAFGRKRVTGPNSQVVEDYHIDRMVRFLSFLGILGGAFVLLDKMVLGDLDLSQGLGQLRFELINRFEHAKSRSPVLWIGTGVYPFACVAVTLYVLASEQCSRWTGLLAGIASFVPALVALTYAGRSLEFLLLSLMFCACLVRRATGSSFLPPRRTFRLILLCHLILMVVGTLYIFSARSVALSDSSSGATANRWLYTALDASLSPELSNLVEEPSFLGELCANSLMVCIYVTHPLPELDYLLTENADVGPFWGRYQIWMLDKLFLVASGESSGELAGDSLDRSGLFFGAWGCLFLDFGIYGAVFVSCLLGICSALVYRSATDRGMLTSKMFLALIYMCILLTPIHSPIHMGNTQQVLGCMIVVPFLMRLTRKRVDVRMGDLVVKESRS